MLRRPTHRLALIGVVLALGFCALPSLAARPDQTTDARRSAQRASHLAAKGKCGQAIAEFDKAITVLRDPALLFNRGECHRRLGNTEAALRDYDEFLKELPNAPNRAEVESQIAELKKARFASADAPSGSDGASAAPGAEQPPAFAPTSETGGPPLAQPTAVAKGPALPPDNLPGAPAGKESTVGSADGASVAASDTPRSLLSNQQSSSVRAAAPPPSSSQDSLARHPWVWVVIAAVLVGAGANAFFVFGRHDTTIPSSDLGNYKF